LATAYGSGSAVLFPSHAVVVTVMAIAISPQARARKTDIVFMPAESDDGGFEI
jgi:hypothetical protein